MMYLVEMTAARAGRNRLTFSQALDNAAWSKAGSTTVTADATAAPDGTTSADKLEEIANTSQHRAAQSITKEPAVQRVTLSVFAKQAERPYAVLDLRSGSAGVYAIFDVQTGAVTTQATAWGSGWVARGATIDPAGGGWYRCTLSADTDALNTLVAWLQTGTAPTGVNSYLGTGGSGLYLWGAQLVTGSEAGDYEPTEATAPPAVATAVLRYTTAASYATRPSETPANTPYLPRIKTAGLFRRDLVAGRRLTGATEVGVGLVELANADGALDALLDYGFSGRECIIRAGEEGAAYPSGFATVLRGTMEQPEATQSTLTIRIRDRLAELDKPLLTTRYAGSNSLPAGVEGVDDLKGRVKPRVYGSVLNVAPPLVNTSRLIYQVSDAALDSVTVYDQGVALTAGAAYSSQADMETTAPAAGQVRAWLAGGMFRLGSTPAGQITCDAVRGAAVANRTPAQILQQIALDAGIASGDIAAADITALDAAAGYDCGLWIDDERTALEACDAAAQSAGAWFGFDRLGVLRCAQVAAAATNLLTYSQQFDNAAWVKSGAATVTANATAAPDGAVTADKLDETATTSQHRVVQARSKAAAVQALTASVFAKQAERRYLLLDIRGVSGGAYAVFDLQTGLISQPRTTWGTGYTAMHAAMEPAAAGFWRCSVAGETDTGTTINVWIQCGTNPTGGNSYLGEVGKGIYLWGAQLDLGAFPAPYNATVATAAPAGTTWLRLEPWQIVSLERRVAADDSGGIPVWRTSVEYARNGTVQPDSTLAGAVTTVRRAFLREAVRIEAAEDATIKTKHLLAPELTAPTWLVSQANAASEAARRLALHKAERAYYAVRARVTKALLEQAELGGLVVIVSPRYGLSSKILRIVGIQHDPIRGALDLTLWG